MPTEPRISEAAMAEYRTTARRREDDRRRALATKRERALDVARQASELLKDRFGATRVVLFGSATREGAFWEHSDIDLAAWDIPRLDYFQAVGELQGLSPEFSIDLFEAEHCKPGLITAIAEEGIPL